MRTIWVAAMFVAAVGVSSTAVGEAVPGCTGKQSITKGSCRPVERESSVHISGVD